MLISLFYKDIKYGFGDCVAIVGESMLIEVQDLNEVFLIPYKRVKNGGYLRLFNNCDYFVVVKYPRFSWIRKVVTIEVLKPINFHESTVISGNDWMM